VIHDDAYGRRFKANRTTADVLNAIRAEQIVMAARKRRHCCRHIAADSALDRGRLASLETYRGFALNVVREFFDQKGYKVLFQ